MELHVVIGLSGMIVDDITVWTDKEKAMAKAKDLCEIYEAHPRNDSSFDKREGVFFAMDDQRENEVHIYFDLQPDPRE